MVLDLKVPKESWDLAQQLSHAHDRGPGSSPATQFLVQLPVDVYHASDGSSPCRPWDGVLGS